MNYTEIKTFEDACKALNITPATFDFSLMPIEHQKSMAAYCKLVVIANALNEDWKADFENANQIKYVPYFIYRSGFGLSYHGYDYWNTSALVGSRLCYKSRELAIYAAKQFADIYNDFLSK